MQVGGADSTQLAGRPCPPKTHVAMEGPVPRSRRRPRRKRKGEPEQTEASSEAGPPSKRSAAHLEVISGSEDLSQSLERAEPKEHLQNQSEETEPQEDLQDSKVSPGSRDKKKTTPSSSKKSGPPTEQRAKKATPSSSKKRAKIFARPSRRSIKLKAKKLMNSRETNTGSKRRQLERVLQTISPHSFVRSRVNDIKNAPWIGKEEFGAVYTWLYSNKTELMSKGVARVAAWNTRGKVPVGIDITAHLCEAFLMEIKHNAGNSYQAVSFGFSVAITR